MNFGIILQIAKTQLLSRIKQTVIAALGVTFGIGMFIGMVSFMTGTNKFLDDLMLSNTAHIRLFSDVETERLQPIDHLDELDSALRVVHHVKPKNTKKNIRNGLKIVDILQEDSRVLGVAPRLTAQAFYTFGPIDINGSVIGVDIVEEDKLFNITEDMRAGEVTNLLTLNNGLIMGAGLAKKLSVKLNDRVTITSSAGVQFQMKVVGIFKTGIAAIDDMQSYSTLTTAQRLLQKPPDHITDINIKLYDIDQAYAISIEYRKQFDIKSEDYNTANAQLQLGTTMRNMITYSVAITLLIVAGFGIYNILNMMIYEKMDDIAILKATGFSGTDVKYIFISQAMIIGLLGGSLGLVIGFLMSYGISKEQIETDQVISLDYLPVNFDPMYYLIGISFALVTTFLAGYLPAKKASKIDPVEIIRGK